MKPIIFCLVIVLAGLGVAQARAADEETLGQLAEKEGRFHEALIHYTHAIQSIPGGDPKDHSLREKIISLVQKIKPPPAIPEEAERHMARGKAAFKAAKDKEGFQKALDEYGLALKKAPWLANAYYNLGVIHDKSENYSEAIWSLKFYLMAAPNAEDARQAKNLIYEIEYRQELAQKKKVQAPEKKDPTMQLVGEWVGTVDQPDKGTYRYEISGEDVYRIVVDGNDINIVLIGIHDVKPYSFFGNYNKPPIGSVVFRLKLNGTTLSGEYLQPFFSQRNPQKNLPVSGEVNDGSNTIVLRFTTSIVEQYGVIHDLTILTMKHR